MNELITHFSIALMVDTLLGIVIKPYIVPRRCLAGRFIVGVTAFLATLASVFLAASVSLAVSVSDCIAALSKQANDGLKMHYYIL